MDALPQHIDFSAISLNQNLKTEKLRQLTHHIRLPKFSIKESAVFSHIKSNVMALH